MQDYAMDNMTCDMAEEVYENISVVWDCWKNDNDMGCFIK